MSDKDFDPFSQFAQGRAATKEFPHCKECPHCKLINPNSALWCECGYDFSTNTLRSQEPFPPGRASNDAILRSSYFLKHWRGELPLATSYWINSVLVSMPFSIFYQWIQRSEIFIKSFLFGLRLLLGVMLLHLVVWIWQGVGVWRSAQSHIKRTGRSFWARSAQVVLVLGLATFAFSGRLNAELVKIALRLDDVGTYSIALLQEGTDIQINGDIAFGLTDELRTRLAELPSVRVIHLNSRGGRIAEATMLRNLIKEFKLSTYTEAGCYSACTTAFLAGQMRILDVNAKLGFHQGYLAGLPRFLMQETEKEEMKFFLEKGVSNDFVRKAFSVPHDDMWYPSTDELIKAGVVTHTFDNLRLIGSKLVDQKSRSVDSLMEETKPRQ